MNRAAALALSWLALAACSDPTISIGTTTGPVGIDPRGVSPAPAECPAGFEHANICCTGDNGHGAAECRRYVGEPFRPCPEGWLTYADSRSCCSLEDPTECAACANCAGSSSPVPNTDACIVPQKCPPGTSPSPNCKGFGCWSSTPSSGDGPATAGGFCSEKADAGPNSPQPPSCQTWCPPTWTAVDEAGVCCHTDARGLSEMCFATTKFVSFK